MQLPPVQSVVAFGRVPQLFPHMPQWAIVVSVLTSHPSAGLPLQSSNGALQVKPHVPEVQVVVALERLGHAIPHMPQFSRSVSVLISQPFTALPSQSMNPGRQVNPQVDALQVVTELGRFGHMIPQPPHALMSLTMSVSQPSTASPLQSSQPASQV